LNANTKVDHESVKKLKEENVYLKGGDTYVIG